MRDIVYTSSFNNNNFKSSRTHHVVRSAGLAQHSNGKEREGDAWKGRLDDK
jgi:hypothetical protein